MDVSKLEAELIADINKLSGAHSQYEVFRDWIACTAIAISNASTLFHDEIWERRENEYLETMKSYPKDAFPDMTGKLALLLENNISDVLGTIYMKSGCGNDSTGQFFTPFHLSLLTAKVALQEKDLTEPMILNEPSCGGGGMIIAVARALHDQGINYQKLMWVNAQDMDFKAVHMCYVQLSLLGIKARVAQGDTLAMQNLTPYQVYDTPALKGCLI